MISVHTLFVLSLISAIGLVVGAPQTTDDAAKDQPPKSEPPKEVPKPEAERKLESVDRTAATKLLKEGLENSGDKGISDDSLNSAVDKIVEAISGERSINSKAEALPLSLGDKFDFLLLKIPKVSGTKEVKKEEKPKDNSNAGRNLGEANPTSPPCNAGCCPCAKSNGQGSLDNVQRSYSNNVNPTPESVEPCAQSPVMTAQLTPVAFRLLGLTDYDPTARALDTQAYSQALQYPYGYGGSGNAMDTTGYNMNSLNNAYQNLDVYGNYYPYQYLSSFYPSLQQSANGWGNNMNMYGYHKR